MTDCVTLGKVSGVSVTFLIPSEPERLLPTVKSGTAADTNRDFTGDLTARATSDDTQSPHAFRKSKRAPHSVVTLGIVFIRATIVACWFAFDSETDALC